MSRNRSWFLLALVPALLALSVSCGGSSKKETTSPTAAGGSGAQATATKPSGGQSGASGELGAVIENFAKVKAFRAKLTIESTGQPKQEVTMEVVLPDKFHMTFSGGGGVPAVEMISIGNDAYIKAGPTWLKQAGAGGGALFDPGDISSTITDAGGGKKGGTETVEGKRCQIYTYSSGSDTTEVCVSSDNLPLRVVTSSGGEKTTIVFTDFNANITIKAPI